MPSFAVREAALPSTRQELRRGRDDLPQIRADVTCISADGVYSGIRAENQKLCALIVIGVHERGQKRFLAIEDGVRESRQSWRELLIGLKARGLVAPKVAIGDGALGFWSAIDEVFPRTRTQRCWVHKTVNVLNYLPRSAQAKAKAGLQAIWMAESRVQASKALETFITT